MKRPDFDDLTAFLLKATSADLLPPPQHLLLAIPELSPTVGFDQRSPHHGFDLYTHIAHVTAAVPARAALRWAALLHDIGKVPTFTRDETGRGHFHGHAAVSAQMARQVLERLDAPADLTDRAVSLISGHMLPPAADEAGLRCLCRHLGREVYEDLLFLQEADLHSKGKPVRSNPFPAVREALKTL